MSRTTKLPSLRGELATNSDTSSTNLNEGLDAALSNDFLESLGSQPPFDS